MKESFVIYKAFYEPISELSDEDLGQLFRCIFLYQIKEIEPANTSRIYMAFQFFKNQFRLDNEKYLVVVNRNKNNGLKGGRPKTQDNPKNPVGYLKPKKADNEKDNDNDNVIKDISKTSLQEVEKIFLEKTESNWTESYAKKEAQKFYNFYGSKGWKVGKEKMKSLPHAIGGWISRCDKPETKDSPKEETEREFRLRMFNERNGL
jgi:hypothetical protein